MTKRQVIAVALIVAITALSFAVIISMDCSHEDSETTNFKMTSPSNDLNIIIVGDGKSAESISSSLEMNDNVTIVPDISLYDRSRSMGKIDAFIFTSEWILSNQEESITIIPELVKSGAIVSLYEEQIDWLSTDLSISYSDDDVMTSVYISGTSTKCYNVTCDDCDEALSRTIAWMNYIVELNCQ